MSTSVTYPHLTTDESGVTRIDGTRYKVAHLAAEHYHYGWTAEELLRQHPDLAPEQVYSALTFFYDHRDAIVADLNQGAEAAANQSAQPFSRDELLARQSAVIE